MRDDFRCFARGLLATDGAMSRRFSGFRFV
jgi:hypothetical protein